MKQTNGNKRESVVPKHYITIPRMDKKKKLAFIMTVNFSRDLLKKTGYFLDMARVLEWAGFQLRPTDTLKRPPK